MWPFYGIYNIYAMVWYFPPSGPKFMSALAQDGAIAEENLSTQDLDRVYSPLREQVSDSCHRQEAILGQVGGP